MRNNKWMPILVGLCLWLGTVTVFATDVAKFSTNVTTTSQGKVNEEKPTSTPQPVPWERTALIGTGIVAGIAGLGGQINPGIVAAGVGGALGSITRLVVSHSVGGWLEHDFPFGTMSVNIIGTFAFGLVSGLVGLRDEAPDSAWFTLITTGFLGGFTTFSTFAYDSVNLSHEEGLYSAATYTVLSVGIGIIAILIGEYIGSAIMYQR